MKGKWMTGTKRIPFTSTSRQALACSTPVKWPGKRLEEGIPLDQDKKIKQKALCPCGSGEKFMNCCGPLSNVVPFCDRRSFERAHDLWERLNAHAGHPRLSGHREKAWAFFRSECLYGHPGTREEDREAFLDWFVMDYALEKGHGVLHDFAVAHPPSPREERMLRAWCNSPLSLYRVLEVRQGRGLLMDDLLRHGEYELLNENIALGVEPCSLLVTRLLPVGECYGYAGVLISIPPFLQQEMLQELDQKLQRFSIREKPPHRGHPGWPEFLLQHGYLLLAAVRSLRLRWEKCLAEDFNGFEDRDLFAALTSYTLVDPTRALRCLSACPALALIREKQRWGSSELEYTWEWSGYENGKKELRGYLQLAGEGLILQCYTCSNLERGKTFVQGLVGELIASQRDNFINAGNAGNEAVREERFYPERDEFLQALFINQSCREWIHTPLPELRGKTPFRLRREEHGRQVLEKLFVELEQNPSLLVPRGLELLDLQALRKSLLLDGGDVFFRSSDWDWPAPSYREVALQLEEIAEAMEFTLQQLANALHLWHDFVKKEQPALKKPAAWAGAVAYLISSLDFGEYTQNDLAAYLNVSSGAISSNSLRMKRTLKLTRRPDRYRSVCHRSP